jgi:hypothetical protein
MFFSMAYIVFFILLAAVSFLAAMFFTYLIGNNEVRGQAYRLLGHLGLFWYAAWSGTLVRSAANGGTGDMVLLLVLVVGGFCGYQTIRTGAKHPWDVREFRLGEYQYPILISVALFFITIFSPEVSHSRSIAFFFALVLMFAKVPVLGFLIRFIATIFFGALFGFGVLAVIVTVVRGLKWGMTRGAH